jgi:hypothetical protein
MSADAYCKGRGPGPWLLQKLAVFELKYKLN